MRGRRRGGLLGAVARTAVITKTASRVANTEADRAAAKRADAQPPPAEPGAPESMVASPAGSGPDDVIAQLKEFAQLRDSGVLTEEEFADQKAKLLGM